jgi:ABC-type glycerol-3-phosphate transport system substrate-binding protein
MRQMQKIILTVVALCLAALVLTRAGMTRAWFDGIWDEPDRTVQLRIWDWWSASSNEEYGAYFAEVERVFEARNPDIDLVYQIVPFGNYVQKLSTAMVGRTPPDIFQSSVYWAEGFYQRGMLLPLDGLLAANHDVPPAQRLGPENFLPSAWRHNQAADGTVFGIPQIIDAQCLLWNLDILRQAAQSDGEIRAMFPHNADGSVDWGHLRFDAVRDWEHFRRIAQKLTVRAADGTLERAGFVLQAYGTGAGLFSPWLAANGGRYQDEAGTQALFARTEGVEALRFIAGLYWNDRVCPPFRRQISDVELFQEGEVACIVAGTWSGKDIMRNTLGWSGFAKTAFPPGPQGTGQKSLTWGNMLVVTRRCSNVEAAWRYVAFVCGLEGNMLRLKHLGYNGPRLDFYQTKAWQEAMAERPYLSNVKDICLVGDRLRHTEIIASNHQADPIVETLLLHYPDIEAGQGPYPSVEAALEQAASHVDEVYRRYNAQVKRWIGAGI